MKQQDLPLDAVPQREREALTRLAHSGEAQRLLELLDQGGGMRSAAQAAVRGDPSALVGMMDRLMNTQEGEKLVEQISRKAREAGLAP